MALAIAWGLASTLTALFLVRTSLRSSLVLGLMILSKYAHSEREPTAGRYSEQKFFVFENVLDFMRGGKREGVL